MFNKDFSMLEFSDIEKLVNDIKLAESEIIDYKGKICFDDEGKKALCKDIVAFANTKGGYLIIGVSEEGGLPTSIIGKIEDKVGETPIKDWIENVVIGSIYPYPEIKVKYLSNEELNKSVLIIYISESYNKPHSTKNKNNEFIEYIRHGSNSDIATPYEKKEMFESSIKNNERFENFLKEKNLYDVNDSNFGNNINSINLFNTNFEEKTPMLIISFIPKLIGNDKFETLDIKFETWLESNVKNCEPCLGKNIIGVNSTKNITLNGILYKLNGWNEYQNNYINYFEINNNGAIEIGLSDEIFRIYDYSQYGNSSEKNIPTKWNCVNLVFIVGYYQQLLNFIKKFFNYIGYTSQLYIQISLINIQNFTLGENFGSNCFLSSYNLPKKCNINSFRINEFINVLELNEEAIRNSYKNLGMKISRAFGNPINKSLKEDGTFDISKYQNFRRY